MSCKATATREAITASSSKQGYTGGEAASTGKEDASKFRSSVPSASSGSSHTSPCQLPGSHFLPIIQYNDHVFQVLSKVSGTQMKLNELFE